MKCDCIETMKAMLFDAHAALDRLTPTPPRQLEGRTLCVHDRIVWLRSALSTPPAEAARGEDWRRDTVITSMNPQGGCGLPNPTCPHCGDTPSCGDGSWRWAGDRWQHRCRDTHPQAGYFDVLASASPPVQPAAEAATAEFDAEADALLARLCLIFGVRKIEADIYNRAMAAIVKYAAGLAAREQPKAPEGCVINEDGEVLTADLISAAPTPLNPRCYETEWLWRLKKRPPAPKEVR